MPLQCQPHCVRTFSITAFLSRDLPAVRRSFNDASRSSSLEAPPDPKQGGLTWRARSHSLGPDSVLDFRSGPSGSPVRQGMPPPPGLQSAQYGRLGREQALGAGEVCGCRLICNEDSATQLFSVRHSPGASIGTAAHLPVGLDAGWMWTPLCQSAAITMLLTCFAQVPSSAQGNAGFQPGRLGTHSLADPMLSRLALDPVMEPAGNSADAAFSAGDPARDSHGGCYPPLQQDGGHPALASRRAISDSPDALTAALPRHSASRLGR